MRDVLFAHLGEAGVGRIDFVVANHAEQDHSGCLPDVLARHPEAILLASPKGRDLLSAHLAIPKKRIRAVEHRERLDLGGRHLEFLHAPWVHWPETILTYVAPDGVLLPCDLFGAHLGAFAPTVGEDPKAMAAAKLYYAQIMMPFRSHVRRHLAMLEGYEISMIAPSHGPAWETPAYILDAHRDWVSDEVKNEAVVPFVSMHGSVRRMADRLVEALDGAGVVAHPFDLPRTDLGALATAAVDAATIVLGASAFDGSPHPLAAHAANVLGLLKPKARFLSLLTSWGWGAKLEKPLLATLAPIKAEVLEGVSVQGAPTEADLSRVDALAAAIRDKHLEAGAA